MDTTLMEEENGNGGSTQLGNGKGGNMETSSWYRGWDDYNWSNGGVYVDVNFAGHGGKADGKGGKAMGNPYT